MLRLAVPSDGTLYEPSLEFLRACGVGVSRRNLRRYTADIPSLPGVTVHFQRGADIAYKVEEGSADLGMIGHDRFLETRREGGSGRIVIEGLGYGHSELVIGVPDSWVDVTSVADLADLSMEFRHRGGDLRVATKYPRLTERFLLGRGVNFFSLVESSGALEAAPAMGYADVIVDISSTGVTMRENRLKTVAGGSVMASEACIVANVSIMAADPSKLSLATALVERIEAYLRSLEFYSVTANLRGEDPDQIARDVLESSDIAGLRGPTIAKVHTRDTEGWYAVTVIVERDRLLDAVGRFRQIGGSSVTVSQPSFVFNAECDAVGRLTQAAD